MVACKVKTIRRIGGWPNLQLRSPFSVPLTIRRWVLFASLFGKWPWGRWPEDNRQNICPMVAGRSPRVANCPPLHSSPLFGEPRDAVCGHPKNQDSKDWLLAHLVAFASAGPSHPFSEIVTSYPLIAFILSDIPPLSSSASCIPLTAGGHRSPYLKPMLSS
jgi:hypothetical protein